jgi:nicotinate-nucleotide pyrophosphorylase
MLDPMLVEKLIDNALLEDIGMVDLTSELAVPAEAKADFAINTRQEIVVAGIDVAFPTASSRRRSATDRPSPRARSWHASPGRRAAC